MSLGEKLMNLRKQEGFSQEELADKLDVTRQTVSKWETNQTIPEMEKAKMLSQIFNVSYSFLLDDNETSRQEVDYESVSDSIDWTKAWSKKYPILASYQSKISVDRYSDKISSLFNEFQKEYDFSDTDAVLILKDILYHEYLKRKNKK